MVTSLREGSAACGVTLSVEMLGSRKMAPIGRETSWVESSLSPQGTMLYTVSHFLKQV